MATSIFMDFNPSGQTITSPTISNPTFTGQELEADGTAGAPSKSFTSEPTLGLWRSAAGTITHQGGLTVTGTISGAASIYATTSLLFGVGLSRFTSPAAGQVNVTNSAQSAGVGLDIATDAILKVRTRAQSAYATVDALGYSVGGVAGANFGPGLPTSITVVNGIITAIS